MQRNSGTNNNLYNNQSVVATQHHQANFNQHTYQPLGGVNEQVLADNLHADITSNCQPGVDAMIKNQTNYGKFIL